ncbi:hypothetical protein Ciccas_011115, partial [Cichlidogyrus casuarinus]
MLRFNWPGSLVDLHAPSNRKNSLFDIINWKPKMFNTFSHDEDIFQCDSDEGMISDLSPPSEEFSPPVPTEKMPVRLLVRKRRLSGGQDLNEDESDHLPNSLPTSLEIHTFNKPSLLNEFLQLLSRDKTKCDPPTSTDIEQEDEGFPPSPKNQEIDSEDSQICSFLDTQADPDRVTIKKSVRFADE